MNKDSVLIRFLRHNRIWLFLNDRIQAKIDWIQNDGQRMTLWRAIFYLTRYFLFDALSQFARLKMCPPPPGSLHTRNFCRPFLKVLHYNAIVHFHFKNSARKREIQCECPPLPSMRIVFHAQPYKPPFNEYRFAPLVAKDSNIGTFFTQKSKKNLLSEKFDSF